MTETPAQLPWQCPYTGRPLERDGETLRTAKGDRVYPIHRDIPVLVEDSPGHLEELERAIRENPAWYESSQLVWHDSGPCRHHLAKRRDFVEGALSNFLKEKGREKVPRLLDLGCGDGANGRWLRNFSEELHACDYNLLRLGRCRETLGPEPWLCLAHIHHLPYADAFFDIIFFNHVLEHIPDDERALKAVRRILKPDGLLILGVPNEGAAWWQLAYKLDPESLAQSDHVHFYSHGEVEEKLTACGFENQQTHFTGWGPPLWKWDETLRQFVWVDGLFEKLGQHFFREQASSLYFLAGKKKTLEKKEKVDVWLYEPAMKEDWETLVEQSPEAWLYHRRDFIEMTNAVMNQTDHSLMAYKQGKPLALFPLNRYRPACPPQMGSLSIGSAGPAFAPNLGESERHALTEALMDRARRLCHQEHCICLTASLPPMAPAQLENVYGASPLEVYGFSSTPTSTYVLDLSQDEESLWMQLKDRARQQVRKAEKAGITFRPAERPEDLDLYYKLHVATYTRTGARPHPRAYFEAIFQDYQSDGRAHILAAEKDGRAIAFANVACFKKAAYYWTGCSEEDALESGANYFLLWKAILAAKARGEHVFEVGEAFPGHDKDKMSGLDTFKRAFGGERRPYHKGRINFPSRKKPSRLRLALYYGKEAFRALFRSR